MDNVKAGDNVLVIWNSDNQSSISNLVEEIKAVIKNGSVVLENSEMITESSRPHSSFEAVLSNWLPPHTVKHTDNILAIIVKLLKPSGKLILKDETDLTTSLKLNGFVNVTKSSDNLYLAEKPKFEIGSKASLKLNGQPAVWKIEDTVEEAWTGANDDDIIDDNQLLDENDLKKPDQSSLRVCATTGKRKACADCSCGLAEELRGEVKETPKSSCGSVSIYKILVVKKKQFDSRQMTIMNYEYSKS
ncbi:anamorsin homolog isoform X2 [Trichoplusia ni]|uniref:Anamorsin homolog isoform X2 n=1 Tax=Trichoplusia ni TaxID=7111 RepID=A0A7E5WBI8_TRINI|nr:anamorsin homolog isoform X2 [Trichoplusia ni]